MSEAFRCPICGADVPAKAKACPECGSDEETGWSEDATYVHLLPERGESAVPSHYRQNLKLLISTTALALVVLFCFTQGPIWGGLSLIALALIMAAPRLTPRSSPDRSPQEANLEGQLYRSLIQKAKGDRDLVERLITYEQHHNPQGNRGQWLADAHDRWDRDRR